MDWATASQEASNTAAEAPEQEQVGGVTGVVAGSNSSKPAGSVASQHRPGLDAALAQMAMSLVPSGSTALSAPAAEALRAALLQAGQPGADAADEGLGAEQGGSEGLGAEQGGSEGRLSRLSRQDVSDEEYAAAEAQLLRRVYLGGGSASRAADGAAGAGGASPAWDGDSGAPAGSDSESDSDDESSAAGAAGGRDPRAVVVAPPAEVHLALASSYGWGRVLRPPRRRGKHVVVDMCMGPQQQYLFADQPAGSGVAAAGAVAAEQAAGTGKGEGQGLEAAGGADDGQRSGGAATDGGRGKHAEQDEAESTAGRTVQQVRAAVWSRAYHVGYR